jgi:hypothetical protein
MLEDDGLFVLYFFFLPYVDQANVMIDIGNLTQMIFTNVATIADTTIGNKQYPITQTD